jgi:Raf kinase inhibitor-like YbhB/YbcL family protein
MVTPRPIRVCGRAITYSLNCMNSYVSSFSWIRNGDCNKIVMKLTSRAFQHEGKIPENHSKNGGNVSPALQWTDAPRETVSLALIMDDPDAPSGLFTHWLLYGMDPKTTELPEHLPASGELPNGARQGRNGFGDVGYGGPRPPSGTHRYFFHLYALDTETDLPAGMTRDELEGAIRGHVIAEAELMGRYQARESTRTA